MYRRRYLALCTVAVAGCSAGEDDGPTPTGTATDTETATATTTATATATATATPNEAVRQGNEAIAEVRNTLDAVVKQYGGAESDDILAADAAAEFNSPLLLRSLEEAGEELERARERAATDAQRRTVERLAGAHRFLVLATEVQNGITRAYFQLTQTRRALDREEPADARAALRRLAAERTVAAEKFARLRAETTGEAVAVLERLSVETYEAKVAQFDAELSGLAGLRNVLGRFADGVNLLQQARKEQAADEDPTESADRAADALSAAADRLATFAADLPTAGDALAPIARGLASLAETKANAARDIRDAA